MAERIALFPGSFDPLTAGHEDLVRRALALADRVVVAVAHAPTQTKRGMFSVEERVEMIRDTFADEPRVEAAEFQGLLVDYARSIGAGVVVRGVRTVADWEYELQMAMMNRRLHPGLETVFLAPAPEHSFVSGTLVRQVAALGGDVSPFVPAAVLRRMAPGEEPPPVRPEEIF
jgi:pantetheine-phosphate adenylyltransferase